MSRADVAALFGIGESAVGNWETGENLPGGADLVKLIHALDVSADWLLFDRGDMKAVTEEDARTLAGKIRALLDNPALALTSPAEGTDTKRVVEETEARAPEDPPARPRPRRRKAGGERGPR